MRRRGGRGAHDAFLVEALLGGGAAPPGHEITRAKRFNLRAREDESIIDKVNACCRSGAAGPRSSPRTGRLVWRARSSSGASGPPRAATDEETRCRSFEEGRAHRRVIRRRRALRTQSVARAAALLHRHRTIGLPPSEAYREAAREHDARVASMAVPAPVPPESDDEDVDGEACDDVDD